MKKLIVFLLFISIFATVFLFCERIPQKDLVVKGELQMVELTELNGVPSEYGPLFAVTANGAHPGWAQLWFLDDQSTIRMVRVNFHEYFIATEAIAIPRN